MKKLKQNLTVFKRADLEALATFDQNTKICTINCGPHKDDMRSETERKFLCDDCIQTQL